MTLGIFALVIFAALLHASWNVVLKISSDGFLTIFLLQTLMGVMGVGLLLVFGFPAKIALPYAIVSGFLHTGYNLFLARSYRYGDLSLVYPVARGTAPLISLVATQIFVHDALSPIAIVGIVVLIIGIWLIALSKNVLRTEKATLAFALTTSCFIGAYTVVDGMGARASGDASAFAGLIFVFDGLGMLIAGFIMRGKAILKQAKPLVWTGAGGALMAGTAYWTIVWAMAHAPIAAVAALRETSVIFALIFSARILKEKNGWQRILGAILVVIGAMALRS